MSEHAIDLGEMDVRKRAVVERLLREKGFDLSRLPVTRRDPVEDPVPASFAQERLWVLDRLGADASAYYEPYRAEVAGPLDRTALGRALAAVVARHEALRTVFVQREGTPVQVVRPAFVPHLPLVDLSALPTGRRRELERSTESFARRRFDLATGPLLRALLVRLDGAGHVLHLDLHHIVCDAASLRIVRRDLDACYEAFAAGRAPRLAPPAVQYPDFARWQRAWLDAGLQERQLAYWRQHLEGVPTLLDLPLDRLRPAVRRGRGAQATFRLGPALSDDLRQVARRSRTTPFTVLLAGFLAVLHRWSGQQRVLAGTPVANRKRPELEEVVGFFVDTVVLDGDFAGDPGFTELLGRVRQTALAAFDHQDLPFARLVEELAPARTPSHTPLVQVMFLLQKAADWSAGEAAGEARGEPRFPLRRLPGAVAKFDLTLVIDDEPEELAGQVDYDADLFDTATIERLVAHLRTVLVAALADGERPVSKLPLLAGDERRAVLADWQGEAPSWPLDRCVHELIAEQAARTPSAPALVWPEGELAYAELWSRVERLAGRLRRRGVGPEVPVALVADRSPEAVIGLLAVLTAGGAYLPLDPAAPDQRRRELVTESGARVLLGRREVVPEDGHGAGGTIVLDEEPSAGEESADGASSATRPDPANLAFVIYTSGSTGRPKGVMVPHRGLVNLVHAFRRHHGSRAGDRVLVVPPLFFDAAAGDVFPVLATGGALVLHPEPGRLSGGELVELVRRTGANWIDAPVALWQGWVDDLVRRGETALADLLRGMMVGGEALPIGALQRWQDEVGRGVPLFNHYGPTEATVCATSDRIESLAEVAPRRPGAPLGRPLPGVRAYVLDDHLAPVPVGLTGELFLGGAGVARGYLRRPAVTAAAFLPDPFAGEPGGRLYRTGDLARWAADGTLRFFGRADHQVKLRGHRIELGEVEHALAAHPAVREAAATVFTPSTGGPRLIAYAVPVAGAAPGAAELRAFLRSRLPEPMVPSRVVVLPALPLTPTGKLDRRALPTAEAAGPEVVAVFDAPRSGLETTIAEVWRRVLGVERVGLHDNFFDLGGHSLLLLRAQSEMVAALGREVSTLELFKYPTVAALAAALTPAEEAARRAPAAVSRPAARSAGVAVVGMAGRFPGAGSVEELWRRLREGFEGITRFRDEDLLANGIPRQWLGDPTYVKAKGILDEVERFDAGFFGISPREAQLLDPQHRLFLETAWHCLEAAACDPDRYPGRIGVFAGVGANGYLLNNLLSNRELLRASGVIQSAIGSEKDFLATRVSYKLDLKGPAFVVQTACSTSLVAVHLACRSLLDGDSDMALAGGVTVPVPQTSGYFHQEGGIFSPDGRCRPFDRDARGTVPGSGVALVALKRFEDAVADGDHVHAVIKGSAINNDGDDKVGYTAPSVSGQVAVIRRALEVAEVSADSIGFVETHGTGTLLGDFIEASALREAFAGDTDREAFCALGSIKSNLGHLDTAAGVAGLIKAVLAVEHGEIPPTLHFRAANEKVHLTHSPFYVNPELSPWPQRVGGRRRAGVSSFGIGGTNAHAVLEEAPPRPAGVPARARQLLLLSARTPAALAQLSAATAESLEGRPPLDLADAAWTSAVGRRAFAHRRAVVAADAADAAAALASGDKDRVLDGAGEAAEDASVVFLFPGGGAQYPSMGQELYESEETYRREIDRCAEALRPHLGDDLRRLLYPAAADADEAAARMERTEWALPALFATEYALARLLVSWGVVPAAMVGHSLGEYTAACLSGVLALEDALALVALRGRLFETLPEGAMLSVALPEDELLAHLDDELSIAAVNLPSFSVVSGPDAAIAALQERLVAEGLDPRRVPIAVAAHSPMVEPILDELVTFAAGLAIGEPRIPYVSNVTGSWVTAEQLRDPAYWGEHLRRTVRFAAGIETLLGERRGFLEVGPGRTLATLASRHPRRAASQPVATTLRHPNDETTDLDALLTGLGRLWVAGVAVDWEAFHAGRRRRRTSLPLYPFERQRYWVEPRSDAGSAAAAVERLEVADWFYFGTWTRALPPPEADPVALGPWLVLGTGDGLGGRLARRLSAAGAEVALAMAGDRFEDLGGGAWRLDPARAEDFERLIATLSESGRAPSTIVHLWSAESADQHAALDRDDFESVQRLGLYSLFHLRRALLLAGGADAALPRVILGTAGAVEVGGDEPLRPAAAALLAGSRLARRTRAGGGAHGHCRRLDLSTDEVAQDADGLVGQLLREVVAPIPAGEEAVALRGGRRWRHVELAERLEPLAGRLAADRTYLVLGGVADLGLDLAAALAAAGRPRLALAGPVELPPRAEWSRRAEGRDEAAARLRRLLALEEAGAEVEILPRTFTTADEVARLIDGTRQRFGRLDGVIHAGGVTGLARLEEDVPGDCERHFRPVVAGLFALDRALAGARVDLVLLVSSLQHVLGDVPSVAYGAAHRVMESFAALRAREDGPPWLAVLWDDDLEPSEGAEVLERLNALPAGTAVTVSRSDLAARRATWRRSGDEGAQEAPAAQALHPRPDLDREYVPPRDDVERQLVLIWQELLGIDRIGVHDSFLELGGDSVIGIQAVAKARQQGLELSQRALYLHPTVAELALAARTTPGLHAQQGEVSGAVELTPIQHWFFARELPHPEHWNLPVVLEVRPGTDLSFLARAADGLPRHHDALRLRFERHRGGWSQHYAKPGERIATHLDLSALPPDRVEAATEAVGRSLQASLDLARGPLVRAAFFHRGERRPALLFLVFHHLVIDAVSLRFVLADLEMAYRQLAAGEEIRLPPKSTSFQHWARRLREQATAEHWEAEAPLWLDPARRAVPPAPLDTPGGDNREASAREVVQRLSAEETRVLLQRVPKALGCDIDDVLLTSFAIAWRRWCGAESVLVEVESHGREPLFPEADVSRTVGWFTVGYPALIELAGLPDDPVLAAAGVKRQLDRIPDGGIGYGVLRYLGGFPRVAAKLRELPAPEVSFLYLGQFNPEGGERPLLVPVRGRMGPGHAPQQPRPLPLELVARVVGGRMELICVYSTGLHRRETVERLVAGCLEALRTTTVTAGGRS